MTCHEFGLIARDYARSEWLSAGERERADAHVSECPTCQVLAANEKALTAALGKVRQGCADIEAPRQVHDVVLAAFDARHGKGRRRWKHLYWAIPVAAGVLVAVSVTRPRVAKVEESPAAEMPEIRTARPPVTPLVAPESQVAAARPAPGRARGVRATAAPGERVTEFIPLRYGKPVESGEQIQVFRMQMRRSDLTRLGLPVAPDVASAFIQADVLLGEDGLAKAIRFVY